MAGCDRGRELPAAEVAATEHAAVRADEHELVALAAFASTCERSGQELGERDRAAAVRLGRAPDELTARSGDRLGDLEPTAEHVEAPDLERRHLAPAESGVGEEQHDVAVLAATRREVADLGVGEIAATLLADAREADAVDRVAAQASVADRVLHEAGENEEDLADRRRGERAREVGHPRLHVSVADVDEAELAPPRQHVAFERVAVAGERRRLQVQLGVMAQRPSTR